MRNQRLNLEILKQDLDGHSCVVCKTGTIHAETAQIAFRIEPSAENFRLLGEAIIYHHLNTLVCCSPACAGRVGPSWAGEAKRAERENLVLKIRQEIRAWQVAVAPVWGAPKSVGRYTKAQYKEMFDKARAEGRLVRMK